MLADPQSLPRDKIEPIIMKASTSSINSDYKLARDLAVLSLISTGEKLNSRGFPQRKNIQNKRKKPRLTFPFAWLGVLCCLFIVQASAAGESDSPSLGSNLLNAYDYQYMPGLNKSDRALEKNQQSRLKLNLNLNISENLFEVEYHFSPKWQVSFASMGVGRGKFSSDNLYSASGRYAVSDSASDAVSPYVGSSYSNSLYEGWGASVVRTFRLTDRLSSQIYLGAYHWQEGRLNFSGSNKEVSSRGISPYGGGGIKYRLSDKVNMLLAWNHFEIQGERYDQLGLKFQYRY